jgi:hypothetical protein
MCPESSTAVADIAPPAAAFEGTSLSHLLQLHSQLHQEEVLQPIAKHNILTVRARKKDLAKNNATLVTQVARATQFGKGGAWQRPAFLSSQYETTALGSNGEIAVEKRNGDGLAWKRVANWAHNLVACWGRKGFKYHSPAPPFIMFVDSLPGARDKLCRGCG